MLEKIEGLMKKWTIHRNWRQDEKNQKKSKKITNTTQYVLDTSISKQAQLM